MGKALSIAISVAIIAMSYGCGGDSSSISGFPSSYPGGYGGPYYRGSTSRTEYAKEMVEDEVLIKFKEETPKSDIDAFLSTNGSKVERVIDKIEVYLVKIPKGINPLQFVEKVREDPRLDFVEPNFTVKISETEIPISRAVTEEESTPGDIELNKAWTVTKGSDKILVAIVDTGVDLGHEALKDSLTLGKDLIDGKGKAKDDNGHGTFLAGIVVARGSDKVSGIAPDCRIIPIKALDRFGIGSSALLAEGIVEAVVAKARVILVGSGTYRKSKTLEKAVDYAWSTGSIVVAPAGNDKKEDPFYPAAYEKCIAVAAVDKMDKKASFSNYGKWVDISAPGYATSTMTSYRSYMTSEGKKPKGYSDMEGTSVAAAYVAGALALLLSAAPDEKASWIRDKLELSSDPIDGLNPKELEGKLGKGRLNIGKAFVNLGLIKKGRVGGQPLEGKEGGEER